MIPGAHRVRRQSWHLRVGSASAAFAARARFRAEVEDLLPAFNEAFDTWAPGESVVRIPRLELKLRVASLDQLGRSLAEALGEALRREAPQRPAPGPPASAASDRRALLLRYLETGALDWHAAHAEAREIAALLRATLLAELQAVAARAPAETAPFERILQYYVRLLLLLPEERWSEAAAGIAFTRSPGPVERDETGPAVAGTAAAPRPFPEALAAAIAAIPSARARLGARAALALAATVLAVARTKPLSREVLRAALSRTLGVDVPPDAPRAVARFIDGALRAPPAAPQTGRASSLRPQVRPRGEQRAAEQAFALMADNAGLVLLHPFLPKLFEECGLCDPRGGIDPPSLPRAAALLHWLAAGRDEIHEFELGAVKVLLGLSPGDPLPAGADLVGAREREEGAALLAAAIGHWTALKGTSTEGFRVSFLQRRGALREEEAGWRLQLEAESFDVLLRQLPWAISTVKLPWMTRPLFTDWPTP